MEHLAPHFRKPEGQDGVTVGLFMRQQNAGDYVLVLERLSLFPNDRILEIGMGMGGCLMVLGGGVRYTGVDHSPDVVAWCRSEYPDETFIVGDVCTDELPKSDATLAINTIQWWADIPAAFANVRRSLAVGGHFVVGVTAKVIGMIGPEFGARYFDTAELFGLLRSAGFKSPWVDVVQTARRPYILAGGFA